MEKNKEIRQLGAGELQKASDLVWGVFAQSVAPGLDREDIDDFWETIDYEYLLHRFGDGELRFWGGFDGGELVGVCAVRGLSHIELLFVNEEHQSQGMGKNLLKAAVLDCKKLDEDMSRITVNAFSDARGFFEALGFAALQGAAWETAFIPMALEGKK